MKKIALFILLGMISGFLGAYLYSQFIFNPISDIRYTSNSDQSDVQFASELATRQTSASSDIDFVKASKLATPSVVYIKTYSAQQYDRYSFYDLFFNGRSNQSQSVGSGSGVIFSKEGYIVTNNHVIDGAEKIEVISGKKTFIAELVGKDPSSDLAVIKVVDSSLIPIQISSSKNLEVGSWVLAVGNPFNLTSTVTAGIVSAKGRNIHLLKGQFPIESFIQTDAAINPGNSGGALVDLEGKLVGINTAILSRTGSYAGYGFAIPVDIVTKVVNDLIKYGQVQKAILGADVDEITDSYAKSNGVSDSYGVVISKVLESSAAQKAGLLEGDIILEINQNKMTSKSDYEEVLNYYSPGDQLKIGIVRARQKKEINAILTNINGTTSTYKREITKSEVLGAEFEIVPKIELDKYKIKQGIRIVKLYRGLIMRLGMDEGFIITSINNTPIKSVDQLTDILKNVRGKVIIEGITKEGSGVYYSFFF